MYNTQIYINIYNILNICMGKEVSKKYSNNISHQYNILKC